MEFSSGVTENLIRSGVVVAAALLGYWLATRVGSRFVKRAEARSPEMGARATTLWTVIRRTTLIGLLILTVLVVFGVWGFSLTPFVALGTVLGAAIGFGAQDLIKDLLAGVFILVEDQFRIGDTIVIAGTTGTVEDIQFRVTVLRDLEGNVHYVPNGQIDVTTNYTSEFSKPVIDIAVAYESDIDKALAVMEDELRVMMADPEWGDRMEGEVEIFGVNELESSSVLLRARLTTRAGEQWAVKREALKRLKKRFDREGIAIPFPQLTIHQPQDA